MTVAISLLIVAPLFLYDPQYCVFSILLVLLCIFTLWFFEVETLTKARRRQILISIGEGNTKIS